jgi:8-oxo-dGTP diphosphatase
VREVTEELGCTIAVNGWLAGESALTDAWVLVVATAELVAGDPVPHEHDAVRWLGADELDHVDWLDADRPFLAELCDLLSGRVGR